MSWGLYRKGCGQELITGNKQDHEFRCTRKLCPIRFGRQFPHSRANLLRVALQMLALGDIVRRLQCRKIGIQRRLGINHQLPRLRQMHDQVRARSTTTAADLELLGEIAVFNQTCQFDDPPQGQLPPAPAHFRAPQRRHEVARFALKARLAAHQMLDLSAQSGLDVTALDFELLCLGSGCVQRRLQRRDELRELLLTAPAGEQLGT